MNPILWYALDFVSAAASGIFLGQLISRWRAKKARALQEEMDALEVLRRKRVLSDAKRTHPKRPGVEAVKIRKAIFRGRQ